MNDKRKNESLALLLTLLLSGITVFILFNCYLRYEPMDEAHTELKQDTIMFGGEFVELGDLLETEGGEELAGESSTEDVQDAEAPEVEGDDLTDNGEPTKQPAEMVTATKEAPMKVKEKVKEEPTKPAGPAVEKKKEEKKEQVKQSSPSNTPNSATNSRVQNAFGKSGSTGTGKQGSPDGNAAHGSLSGKPGLSGLVGYTVEYWGRPHSKWTGTVRVRVRVNTRGKVVEAKALDGTGEAWAHPEVRKSCEDESCKSAFSVPTNTTTEGVGFITWKFI